MGLCSYRKYLGHDIWEKLGWQQLARTDYLGFFRKSGVFETLRDIATKVCPMPLSQPGFAHYKLSFTVYYSQRA